MARLLRALGYVRVSSASQVEHGYSLAEQERSIREYCQRRGHHLVEVLRDEGVSGRALDRPAVRRMLELAQAEQFDVLVVVRLDRIGRKMQVIHEILGRLEEDGVEVESVETGPAQGRGGRLMRGFESVIAEDQWHLLRQMTMDGRREKAETGRYPGNLKILGYDLIPVWQERADPRYRNRSGELVINEPEAGIVRELFRRFDAGASMAELTRWLAEAGAPTKRGGKWRATVVRGILSNRAYVGELRYGASEWRVIHRQTDHGEEKQRVRRDPEAAPIIIPCPPLVDLALFNRVQVRLQDRRETYPGRSSLVWPLRGCISCATCRGLRGGPTTYSGWRHSEHRDRPGYIIRRYFCPSCHVSVLAERLERDCLELLRRETRPGVLEARAYAEAVRRRESLVDVDREQERLQRELCRCDDHERSIAEQIRAGIAAHIVTEQVQQIHQDRQVVQEALLRVQQELAAVESPEAAAERAAGLGALAREALSREELSPEELQTLFRRHVRVVIRQNREADIHILTA